MFLRVAGRITINAASLNTQGGAGTNYIEMTKVPVVVRTSTNNQRIVEVPAISGNMVRHCHFAGFLEEFRRSQFGTNLTLQAWQGDVALRFGARESQAMKANNTEVPLTGVGAEGTIIQNFADADLYGFLVSARDTSVRRTSILGFSFLLPVEDLVEEVEVKSVIHNRVAVDPSGQVDPNAMMPFKREYASAPYGFASFLDLTYVGRPLANRAQASPLSQGERRERARATVLGFVQLLSGKAGAGISRGLPVSRVDSLLIAASERPIPLVVNGYYRDYLQETQSLLSSYAALSNAGISLHVYPQDALGAGTAGGVTVQPYTQWVDLIRAVSEAVTTSQGFSDNS